jgi:hypothetical protein
MFGWLVWKHKVAPLQGLILGTLASAGVEYINLLSGNFGWKILLHFSFVGGRYPAEITSGITLSQYAHVFIANAEVLLPQLAPFLLLGVIARKLSPSSDHEILLPVAAAAIAHYVLFPSAEARYFAWACLISGMVFVRSIHDRAEPLRIKTRVHAAAA